MGQGGPEQVRTRAELARELSELRARSGLTLRQLSRQVDAPVATLGDYFAGRHLPGPAQFGLYRSMLAACGVTDPARIEAWMDALHRVRQVSDARAAKSAAPYRGLEPFREEDSQLFFGRSAVTSELVARLEALARDPGPSGGVLMLIGASGSGKSSLLAAGLVPALRAGALDTPGASWECVQAAGAEATLAALQAPDAATGRRRLLLLDQFEDILALPADSDPRREILGYLADPVRDGTLVVAAVRADFYHAAAAEPALLPALRHAHFLLGPMTEQELREAIVEPARQVGATLEYALVELILADLAPGRAAGFAHDPGALPFLSHVLLATWERAPRNLLTVADYRAASGLRGAIAQSAEDLYASLSADEQALARRVFSRLVRVEGDSPVTRRRVSRTELDGISGDAQGSDGIEKVLERFVSARLLTADADSISISHDALLSAWPRLDEWIRADRAGLRLHQQLSDGANTWTEAERDESLLWRGTRLELATEWAADPGHDQLLNRTERAFLAESAAQRDAQALAARRRTRTTQVMLAVLAALALAVSGLAAYGFDAGAATAQARDQALSRQVAIEAQQLQGSQPALAAQLALAAYRISPTVQARSTLIDATAGDLPTRLLGPAGPDFVAVSRDTRILASAQSATDTVQLYSLVGPRPVRLSPLQAGPPGQQNFAVAISPDGRLLASGGTDRLVRLWDLASPATPTGPAQVTTLGGMSSTVYALAFDPAHHQLAAANADGHVYQWNVTDPAHPVAEPAVAVPGGAAVKAVAYTPDGKWVVAGGADGTVMTWRPGQASPTTVQGTGNAAIETVAVDPDGSTVVTGGDDDVVRVLSLGPAGTLRPAHAPLGGPTGRVISAAFSPDGATLAVGSADGSVYTYATADWKAGSTLHQPNPVTGLAYTPDGRTLVTANSDGTTRLYHLPVAAGYQEPGAVYFVSYTPDGRILTDVTGGAHGAVGFWDATDPLRPARVATVAPPPSFGPVEGTAALSPDGRLLAMANHLGLIQLADVTDPHHPRLVGPPLSGAKPYVEQIAFSPNGRFFAAGDDSGQVRLWDVSDPSQPRPLPTLADTTGQILGLAFSPDGRLLAAASSDAKVRLYDVADPAHPRLLATLSGFGHYAYTAAFTPDGRTLIAGSADGTVRMWDVTHPARPTPRGRPLSGPTGYVYQLAVGPGGHTLAAATTNHAVWLWDITDPAHPKHLATLAAAQDSVYAVGFSPTGGVLAAAGSDDTLHFWAYRASDAARQVCAAGGDAITRAEWGQYVQGKSYSPPCPT